MTPLYGFLFCIVFCISNFLSAKVYDNRFMPLLWHTYSRTCDRPSEMYSDVFIMSGNRSFGKNEEEKGLFEMFGNYDENAMADALVALGKPDPFVTLGLTEFRGQEILWDMDGKIETQGISLQYDQHLWRWFSTGFTCFFMHAFTRNNFSLPAKTISSLKLTEQDQLKLDQARRLMNIEAGLEPATWSRAGFSDLDWYVRMGNIWEYMLKCRRIDAGLKLGVLIPSGLTREVNNPASIPFGGNGFWGMYVAADVEAELKEDWKVGMLLRCSQRFARTKTERLPVAGEQLLYGATSGKVRIDPGFTTVVAPYARLENIREGFGIQAKFTLIAHEFDEWTDKRPVQLPLAQIDREIRKTSWNAEYLSVSAFYDTAKVMKLYDEGPIVYATWDIPVQLICARGVGKTNCLMFGVEFTY